MALIARKVATSWKSSSKVYSVPPSASTPSITRCELPLPPMRAPMRDRNMQNSCTCGSQAALTSVERPLAVTAQSTTFSVVVTDA